MKTQVKVLAAVVLLSGIVFSVISQAVTRINFDVNRVVFRTSASGNRFTTHFGDLELDGGHFGSNHGWLIANVAHVFYDAWIYRNLNVLGSKNFVHPHPTDGSKLIRYVAIESGEALTLARGTTKTINGQATIKLPEHFSLVTSETEPITVILTPKGAPVLLYTKQSSREKVVVAMKASDFSEFKDIEFAYQITGVRDGFEQQEVIVNADRLDSSSTIRDDVQKRIIAHTEKAKARQRLKHQENE